MRPLLSTLLFLIGFQSYAMDTTDVLPKGIRNMQLRMGTVGGLNQYYSDTGDLGYLSDKNTVSLDAATISTFNATYEVDIDRLVNALNAFGPDNLGDQFFAGDLTVDIQPDLSYAAPVFLYGYTKRLTIGLGLPVFSYKTSVNTSLKNSNYQEIRAQVGGVSADIDSAFNQLNANMNATFNKFVSDAGYSSIEQSETFLGDIQLVAAYQLSKRKRTAQTTRLFLNLPTGPKPDPDNLADVESFGRSSIKPVYIAAYKLSPRSQVIGSMSYNYVIPGKMKKRVPLDEDDSLPAANQKRTLIEDIGDTWAANIGVTWDHNSNFTSSLGYTREEKAKDSYSNSNIGDSSLLEKNTAKSVDIGRFEFSYNTISDFKQGKSAAPMKFTYELAAVIAGTNIENQIRHELTVSLYF